MSGVRAYTWRQGDRSEYLAVYVLSALGLVTQVPRQEDIGFDLICNISDEVGGLLTFRNHYAVTVKSIAEEPRVTLKPPRSKKDDPKYEDHFMWMFNLELPLMLAMVDRDKQTVALYSTLPAWFLLYVYRHECGVIELIPDVSGTADAIGVGRPQDGGIAEGTGGRKKWEVHLGHPIAVIGPDDLLDKSKLVKIKAQLKTALDYGAYNARNALAGAPVMYWPLETTSADGVRKWGVLVQPEGIDDAKYHQLMLGLTPGLMSAAFLYKMTNRPKELDDMKAVMQLLPIEAVPAELKGHLPEIFPPPDTDLGNHG